MARQYFGTPITPIPKGTPTSVGTFSTATDVSKAPQPTIGANQLEIGSTIVVAASGTFSTTGTPTLQIGLYYGGVAGTALALSVATTTASGAANLPWRLEYTGVVTADGASGTIEGGGFLMFGTTVSAYTLLPIPGTAQAAVTIDTTNAKALTIGAVYSASSASNTVTVRHYAPQILN